MCYVTKESRLATSQQATSALFVWDASKLATLSSVSTKQKSISQLAFSGDGKLLVSVGQDNSVVVTEWKGQRIIAEVFTTSQSFYQNLLQLNPNLDTTTPVMAPIGKGGPRSDLSHRLWEV